MAAAVLVLVLVMLLVVVGVVWIIPVQRIKRAVCVLGCILGGTFYRQTLTDGLSIK